MPETSCVYLVTQVPSECTLYREGDVVTTACAEPCADGIIGVGPCAGTVLRAVSEKGMTYPPEDETTRAAIELALQRDRGEATPQNAIETSSITGHYPRRPS